MLDKRSLAEYRRFRGLAPDAVICNAPFVNLSFHVSGKVLACHYHNPSHVLGVYPRDSVMEMWIGAASQALRSAILRDDLSLGCQFCEDHILQRSYGEVFANCYGGIPAPRDISANPAGPDGLRYLPTSLQFELHNTCNLECVMCNGHNSSSVRAGREQLPPVPMVYDDAFVEQLTPLLPHVQGCFFVGGEPFLQPIYYRIWERIPPHVCVEIITNGTILNDRVINILQRLNCGISISVDAVEKTAYEAIRQNACFERTMANIDRFRDVLAARGRPLGIMCCVMRANWRHIPEMLHFCNARGMVLSFSEVYLPLDHALHTLAAEPLQQVIRHLEQSQPGVPDAPLAQHNLHTYRKLIDHLKEYLDPVGPARNSLHKFVSALVEDHAAFPIRSLPRDDDMPAPAVSDDERKLHDLIARHLAANLLERTAENIHPPSTTKQAGQDSVALLRGLLQSTQPEHFLRQYIETLLLVYPALKGRGWEAANAARARLAALVAAIIENQPDHARIVNDLLDEPAAELFERITK